MMEGYGWLLVFYAVPFGLAAVMPRGRWLAAYAALAGVPVGWAILDLQRAFDDPYGDDPGIGGVVALAHLWASALGLASGVVTRGITLGMRRRAVVAVVTLAGLVAVPGALAGWDRWEAWKRRPPEEACIAGTFAVELAGRPYLVPAAPMLEVVTGRGGRGDSYYLSNNAGLRAFCAATRDANGPMHATALILRFDRVRRAAPVVERFCVAATQAWAQALCEPGADAQALGYPEKVALYARDEYDHRRMLATGGSTLERLAAAQEAAAAQGAPFTAVREGAFDRYPDGTWVAAEGGPRTPTGEPFAVACRQASTPEALYCTVTHGVGGGADVHYGFVAPAADVPGTALRVDATVRALFKELDRFGELPRF